MPNAQIHTASSLTRGIDLGLDRIKELLARLSLPQSKFPIIHVAGTNSKGSTIAYLSSILNDALGIKAGSFVSPHLLTPRDCCKIGNEIIDASIWEEAGKKVRQANSIHTDTGAKALDSSPFELLTAQCFVAFDLLHTPNRPELLLVEVGMGGALDATNCFESSQVLASVICPIDYDHISFLGDTLSEIAEQKAGIIRQGGLCVMADQRRNREIEEADDQFNCTTSEERIEDIEEREADEVEDTIRKKCLSLHARLVKAYVPWRTLSSDSINQTTATTPWSATTTSHATFTPILSPSKLHQGVYVSSTGDPVLPGPSIHLPATRAALTGCHSALQTLWSIARDETPCALGMPGSDVNEDIRLRIAYGLRDDFGSRDVLARSIEQTRIHGRAEWMDLELFPEHCTHMELEGQRAINHSDEKESLHVLVDGAHNASAASALRRYVESCIRQRLQTSNTGISHITITWILAFSKGKAVEEILTNLLADNNSTVDILTSKMNAFQFKTQIDSKVACLAFSTPVEGMPWVHPLPTNEIKEALGTGPMNVSAIDEFSTLRDALRWAAKEGDGRSISTDGKCNIIVIAGSLYLVSDVYRLFSSIVSSL